MDIYNADEIIWAILTRVDAKQDLVLLPAGTVVTGAQTEAVGPWAAITKMGFDVTVPFEHKWIYTQGEYPKVDLERWLTKDEITRVRAQQSKYARVIADRRA